jgi:hypothetical protein
LLARLNLGQVFNSKLDSFANVDLKFVPSKQPHVPLLRLELLAIVFLETTNSYHTALFGTTNFGQYFNSKLDSFANVHLRFVIFKQPLVELKNWPMFSHVSLSFLNLIISFYQDDNYLKCVIFLTYEITLTYPMSSTGMTESGPRFQL